MDILFEELASDFQRAVELAAMAAVDTRGRGDKLKSDIAATQAMRERLNKIRMRGIVRVGEGELDGCDSDSMLPRGEKIGRGWTDRNGELYPEVDAAFDPLEGTNLCARSEDNAICVGAFTERDGMVEAPDIYMDKIAVGPAAAGRIDINAPVEYNLKQIAKGLNTKVSNLAIMVLERARHEPLIAKLRAANVDLRLIRDGDLSAGVLSAIGGSGIAAAWGIGGGPEGVLLAAAMKVLGGEIQGRFLTKEMLEHPDDREIIPDDVAEQLKACGIKDPTGVLTTDDLVNDKKVVFTFAAVTDNRLIQGVRFIRKKGRGKRVRSALMMACNGQRVVRWSDTTEVIDSPSYVFVRD